MIRHFFIAAWRNIAASKLQSAIAILGLTIGISAALLMSLLIRNQLTYEHFIPGYQRVYLVATKITVRGQSARYNTWAHPGLGGLLKLKFSEIEATTRLFDGDHVLLRHGEVEAVEKIDWADANFFDLLPLPVFAGDLKKALTRPDGIVLTRSMARKYFGRDDVVGQTIDVVTDDEPASLGPLIGQSGPPPILPGGTHPMTITAVIQDMPVNGTELDSGVFISGLAPFSKPARLNAATFGRGSLYGDGETFVRLTPNASVGLLQTAISVFLRDYMAKNASQLYDVRLIPIDQVHLFPDFNPDINGLLDIAALTSGLILFIAGSNFVNLSTARSARRALEVGIRKVSGAGRRALILQFLGESLVYVAIASCLAVAVSELLLLYVNAALQSGAVFDYGRDPSLVALILLGTLALGVAAGLYPAFVLSAFRPASVLKGRTVLAGGSNLLRRMLVTAQFAMLIGLAIAAVVVYRQREYAISDALRVNTDQMVVVRGLDRIGAPCKDALMTRLRAMPGVRGAFCSNLLSGYVVIGLLQLKNGSTLPVETIGVQPGLLELYGIKPVAGRFFRPGASSGQRTALINETAARRLGFASPSAAVGKTILTAGSTHPREILGIVPDFMLNARPKGVTMDQPVQPAVYNDNPDNFRAISVKLTGHDIPETLIAIDRAWAATTKGQPNRFFLAAYIQNLYLSMLRQAEALTVFSGIALFLACLGLIGLAISTAKRRTKEIGIRKAMGASTSDVVGLLAWEFSKPVLWANLIAWPIAYYAMNRWLNGFAYRVDLPLWLFPTAGATALLIALATVVSQAILAARQKPILALRYE